MEQMTLITAIRKHIGMLPGQGLQDFAADVRRLTPEDREWFKREFVAIGVEITEKQ